MRLVCPTEEWLGKYCDLCFQRGLAFKPWLSRNSLLVAEGQELVAGVMAYDSTGPFLFFEHLVTNETAPLTVRWAAVSLMANELMAMCRHVGKVPQVTVRHRGIKRILKRAGLQEFGAVVMTCGYSQLETNDDQEIPFYSPQHPRSGANPAPAVGAPARDPEDGAGVHAEVPGGRGTEAGSGVS